MVICYASLNGQPINNYENNKIPITRLYDVFVWVNIVLHLTKALFVALTRAKYQ
jgi:hypothetical protein